MPELPEVQTVVNQLRPSLLGETVKSLESIWPKVFHNFTDKKTNKKIVGQKVIDVCRRAKFIIIKFQKGIVAIHLRMTGKLYFQNSSDPLSKYATAFFTFESSKKLIFDDVRKFGRIYFYSTMKPINNRHGPEPLDKSFTSDLFIHLIKTKKRNIKALLLDQSVLAGLGNIYVDESLWKTGIHPNSISSLIPEKILKKLYINITEILKDAIQKNGTTIINFSVNGESGKYKNELKIYGRNSLECRSCQYEINKIRVAGRGTYICTKCQKKYH